MRVIAELIGRVGERFRDPRKKELDGLISTFKGQIENLLGEKDTREFSLDSEETRRLGGPWELPVIITIARMEGGFRVDIRNEVSGEALKLKGNKPRFWETGSIGGESWEAPKPGGDLGLNIFRLKEWIGYVVSLEGLKTVFPTPSTSVS